MSVQWQQFYTGVKAMSEQELWAALQAEVAGKRRWSVALRLHQRYCAVRAARERQEFKAACAKTSDSLPPPPAPTTP